MARRRGTGDSSMSGASSGAASSSRQPRMTTRSTSGGGRSGTENAAFRRLAAELGLSHQLQRITDDDHDNADEDDAYARNDRDMDAYGDEDAANDAPLTPLRSDYSASESLSSDLSLPRSFGNYDMLRTRKPPFDDELQRTTQRNTERNASAVAAAGSSTAAAAGGANSNNEMMRKFYEAQVEKIRTQLSMVTQAHRQVETTLHEERKQWASRLADMEKTLQDERATHQKESDKLQSHVDTLHHRLAMEKTHLVDLQISDALAEQLSRQQEDDLTVKEFMQLHVHRKLRSVESELETTRKELESLRSLCASYKNRATSASDEVSQVARVAEAKELRLQHELDLSEATRVELERQVASLCGQLEMLKDADAKRQSEAQSRPVTVDVYTENEQLKTELQLSSERQRVHAEKSDKLSKQMEDLQQQVVLLQADKAFLQDAKKQLEDHEMRLMAKNKELQNQADLSAVSQLADAHALHKTEEETRAKFEKQLAIEIDKFMEMSKREIDTIRATSQLVYERENRLLVEARGYALTQIDTLQTRLQSVQNLLDEKVHESMKMESTHTTVLASLRSDLKMKHFEMAQLGMSLEEKSMELRGAKMVIEMLTQKVDAHKDEFARLEATSTMRISQLEASLETERRRLEEYERLEVDLDDAVLQTGAIRGGGSSSSSAVVGTDEKNQTGQLNDVFATFEAIPTSTKRRFHQSVQLAQRVVKYQKEAMELQRQLEICQAEKGQLASQAAGHKRQLANLHQPQSYLIDKIARKDAELVKLQKLNEQLQAQLSDLRAEYQHANTAKMALQGQLQQVLARREELDGLKVTVQALRQKLTRAVDVPTGDPLKVAPSPVMLKNPPSPHLLSQMVRPPTPQTSRNGSPLMSMRESDPAADGATPPKWYIKLRS